MTRSLQTIALIAVTILATTFAWHYASAQTKTAPPPQLVEGLPDFTRLVKQVGSGVVSIEAVHDGSANGAAMASRGDQIPEIFRQLLGPGFRMPEPSGERQGTSMGSGFIISEDGYVLTNHHVIDGADKVTVRLSDQREFTAQVIGSDEMSDVALLKIDATGLPALRIGDSHDLNPGEWVVAIGSPFGLDHTVTAGIVSAVGRYNPFANQRYVPFIQTDVAINRGNSGGPLLDTRGQVVGINSQIFSNSGGYMGVSFAIPIDVAMNAVEQLKADGHVSRGQIGVTLQPMDAEMARGFGLPDARGALINRVLPGTPADKAGLKRGDVIREFNGRQVDTWSELPPMVGALPPGTKTKLSILRDGKPRTISLVLGELNDSPLAAAASSGSASPATVGNSLGIIVEDIDADARKRLGLDDNEGVVIARIEGADARRSGLRPGDVIVSAAGEPVASARQLDQRLNEVEAGDTVMLLVRRGGNTQFVAVTAQAG